MLLMGNKDLAEVQEHVFQAKKCAVHQFTDTHARSIRDFNFKPGDAVLVHDSAAGKDLGKGNVQYYRPMVVLRHNQHGAYELAELDSTKSKLRYGAFTLILYYTRRRINLDLKNLAKSG
jgi:hypothetical protein